MTGKEMKKLRRDELLEMLIEQTKRKDELEIKLAQAEEKLRSREIDVQEAGTLAEAALQLNAIFEAADAAATQYLENIRARAAGRPVAAPVAAEPVAADPGAGSADAREQAQLQLAEVAAKCQAMEEETRQKCEAMTAKAKKEADSYWAEVSRRIEQYLEEHEELTEWLLRRREARMREGKS